MSKYDIPFWELKRRISAANHTYIIHEDTNSSTKPRRDPLYRKFLISCVCKNTNQFVWSAYQDTLNQAMTRIESN